MKESVTNLSFFGWGGVSHGSPDCIFAPASASDLQDMFANRQYRSFLGRGLGRSYGDSALNSGGALIDCRFLDRFLSFDPASGVLECEAGVSILDINHLLTTAGWMLPVVPGTQYVTIGGAIANDVHGKNHIQQGSFGAHVISLNLVRSDGETQECSIENNSGLFAATIGGLGLTGLILSAKLQLRPVQSLLMKTNRTPFENLKELFSLAREQRDSWEYHVAWLDPDAACRSGHYMTADHVNRQGDLCWSRRRPVNTGLLADVASDLPGRWLMKAGNFWYRKGLRPSVGNASVESELYPLDRLPEWNSFFGKPGFFQHQCVLPEESALLATEALLIAIYESGLKVSLAVGKWFGHRTSPGLLSFPMPGFSLALDFANRGLETRQLLDSLDKIVASHGGRIYPAKDARMPAAMFADGYPELEKFSQYLDPLFASDFWRRMEQSA